MAVQFTDFSRAPIQKSPFDDMLENVLKGYTMSQQPAKMADEAQQRQLANQLSSLKVKEEPERFKTEQAYKQALMDKARTALQGGAPKFTGDVGNQAAIDALRKTDPEAADRYQKILDLKQGRTKALTERSQAITEGRSWDGLPMNDKKQSVAYFRAMGVDPIQAVTLGKKGVTPTEYAQEHGFDISKIEPSYAPGEQTVKEAQRASAYADEIDKLEQHVSEGLGEYQNKVLGWSFNQIADAAEGKDPDKQGRLLAARALLPELSSLRSRIMGGNTGIELLKELEAKSLGQLKIIEGLVDKKTYKATQDYMRKWIDEASRVRVQSLLGAGRLMGGKQSGVEAESNMDNDPLGLR